MKKALLFIFLMSGIAVSLQAENATNVQDGPPPGGNGPHQDVRVRIRIPKVIG